jgi:hypothetical protein
LRYRSAILFIFLTGYIESFGVYSKKNPCMVSKKKKTSIKSSMVLNTKSYLLENPSPSISSAEA